MGYEDLVRTAVSLANSQTSSLQEEITLERWIADDDQGKHVYASPLKLKALVEHKTKRLGFDQGMEIVATTIVTILKPIKKLSPVVTGREEPVDERDKLTLASGVSGPILQLDHGLTDPSTTRPYLVQVFLGGYQAGR